mgnify:CR=1 FL=1
MAKNINLSELKKEVISQIRTGNNAVRFPTWGITVLAKLIASVPDAFIGVLLKLAGVSHEEFQEAIKLCNMIDDVRKEVDLVTSETPKKQKPPACHVNSPEPKPQKSKKCSNGHFVFHHILSNGKPLVVEQSRLHELRPTGQDTISYTHTVQTENGLFICTQKMEVN